MDPEEWEEGVILRPFIGRFPSALPKDDSSNSSKNSISSSTNADESGNSVKISDSPKELSVKGVAAVGDKVDEVDDLIVLSQNEGSGVPHEQR